MDFSGKAFGHYLLLKRIGSGGYADVYKAFDMYLHRYVAVKVLHTRINPRDLSEILQNAHEARIAASFRHPHIVNIIEYNIHKSIPYIVMEFAAHGSLRQAHSEGVPLPWNTIICYLGQIAKALTFIHSQGFIHQDVKPENILLGDHGHILLSDFGTVAFIQNSDTHAAEIHIGTIGFMAPERFTDDIQTPASDVYSLAIVVYKWLTGRLPFTGSAPEIALKHLHTPLPTGPLTAQGIELPIQQVLCKALAKDHRDRYQSALEFYEALKKAKKRDADYQQMISEQQTSSKNELFRWAEMPLIFIISMIASLLLASACYIMGIQLETEILIWQISLSLLSLSGVLIRKNWLALRFVFATFTIALMIGFLSQSWPIFCLTSTGALLLSAIIGFLRGY